MADIFYTDAPTIDGTAYPWPAAEPARTRRTLRNWHKFVLTYGMILAGLALLLGDLVLRTGGNMAGAVVVVAGVGVVGLIAGLVVAGWAARNGQL
jgi:hypothetical protein